MDGTSKCILKCVVEDFEAGKDITWIGSLSARLNISLRETKSSCEYLVSNDWLLYTDENPLCPELKSNVVPAQKALHTFSFKVSAFASYARLHWIDFVALLISVIACLKSFSII